MNSNNQTRHGSDWIFRFDLLTQNFGLNKRRAKSRTPDKTQSKLEKTYTKVQENGKFVAL